MLGSWALGCALRLLGLFVLFGGGGGGGQKVCLLVLNRGQGYMIPTYYIPVFPTKNR